MLTFAEKSIKCYAAARFRKEIAMREMTVGFLLRGGSSNTEILLGRRRSTFAEGLLNGPGGKLEAGEDPLACLYREIEEEIGVKACLSATVHVATVNYFHPIDHLQYELRRRVHFYIITKWEGIPRAIQGFYSVEWFSLKNPPYPQMHPDSQYWLPAMAKELVSEHGKMLGVDVYYADDGIATISKMSRWHLGPIPQVFSGR